MSDGSTSSGARNGAAGASAGPQACRGRRPGESGTRDAILKAARAAFSDLGYDRATIRGIARAAGVDPALVLHYFGSKAELFVDVLQLRVDPGALVSLLLASDDSDVRAHLGETVVRSFLEAWEPEENREPLVAIVRSGLTNATAQDMVRDYLGDKVFGPVTRALGVPDGDLRAALVGSQFIGLAIMRYVTRIEPIASASREQIVAAVGPTVQRYLLEPLDLAGRESDAKLPGADTAAGEPVSDGGAPPT